MLKLVSAFLLSLLAAAVLAATASGQGSVREIRIAAGQTLEVTNPRGRVIARTDASLTEAGRLELSSPAGVADGLAQITATSVTIPATVRDRIDLELIVPERTSLRITTTDGEIRAEGNFLKIEARSETGTIAVDLPEEQLEYSLLWTESRPRFVADFPLEPVKERSRGRFEIKGRHTSAADGEANDSEDRASTLETRTARGIVAINVPPNEITGDLRERPLTEAAKGMIRSGDSILMEAIRRAAPKYYGDYARSLPPFRREPGLRDGTSAASFSGPGLRRATVAVTDENDRAIAGIRPEEFEIIEAGRPIEPVSVKPVEAPVNLVLLLDVSGSVEGYVNFIRRTARAFIATVDPRDRVAIVTFADDVKTLVTFTNDKAKLSASLDTFDAGGSTAFYDAVGYTVAETLRPIRGERTAIVILTDGDDNRSFLPFDPLVSAVGESGALIYPLYIPSALVAAAETAPDRRVDPLRARYFGLSKRAEGEGERLAKASGGVYFPISQIAEIDRAYKDIARQLRAAYDITYRSELAEPDPNRPSPRLRIRVKRPNAQVRIDRVTAP